MPYISITLPTTHGYSLLAVLEQYASCVRTYTKDDTMCVTMLQSPSADAACWAYSLRRDFPVEIQTRNKPFDMDTSWTELKS